KVRRPIHPHPFPGAVKFLRRLRKGEQIQDLACHGTAARIGQIVAADVHLWAMDQYRESTAVQKKVLIIDDSPAQVKLMQSLLEKEGYWPIGLSDPKQVESTIAIERPNVIL